MNLSLLFDFRSKWPEVEKRMKSRVGSIIPCDVLNDNPLAPLQPQPYDCLISSLALQAACRDEDAHRRAVKNVVNLVKPHGHIVFVGSLGESYYSLGDHKFFTLPLSRELVEESFEKAGCDIVSMNIQPLEESLSDIKGVFVSEAQRK